MSKTAHFMNNPKQFVERTNAVIHPETSSAYRRPEHDVKLFTLWVDEIRIAGVLPPA